MFVHKKHKHNQHRKSNTHTHIVSDRDRDFRFQTGMHISCGIESCLKGETCTHTHTHKQITKRIKDKDGYVV